MSDEANIPSWVRGAARVDRPKIDAWYRPEDGALEGTLIWRASKRARRRATSSTRTRFASPTVTR